MYAEERQQAIADLVAQRGRLSVNELAESFQVTTETVRRDLSLLERAGLVRRVHGGTVNDVILATVTGGLRSWLMTRAEPVPGSRTLRAMVPVDLRPPERETEPPRYPRERRVANGDRGEVHHGNGEQEQDSKQPQADCAAQCPADRRIRTVRERRRQSEDCGSKPSAPPARWSGSAPASAPSRGAANARTPAAPPAGRTS